MVFNSPVNEPKKRPGAKQLKSGDFLRSRFSIICPVEPSRNGMTKPWKSTTIKYNYYVPLYHPIFFFSLFLELVMYTVNSSKSPLLTVHSVINAQNTIITKKCNNRMCIWRVLDTTIILTRRCRFLLEILQGFSCLTLVT